MDRLQLILSAVLIAGIAMSTNAQSNDWRTHAERTDYRETSPYAETIAYCERLDRASSWISFTSFGTSPEGRSLPLLVLSRDEAFTPEAAHKTGKPVVLIQNGIHSGEIDGKEACLALAREIAITKSLASLLDHATVLVIPIYNTDGHERSSPYNRINQDGPADMGWRATAQNYNLNRDYLKADAPETRAFLKLFNAWMPDLFIDTHVTDGADFQYDVLYTMESHNYVAPEIAAYVDNVFQPHVQPAMERAGHIVEGYFYPGDSNDPSKGILRMVFTPRFSNGFAALRNRPMILVETHMLKSFKIRTIATYDLLVETLKEVNRDPKALRDAVVTADKSSRALATGTDPDRKIPLGFELIADKSRKVPYRGVKFTIDQSDISGGPRITYSKEPLDSEVDLYDAFRETSSVTVPGGYIIPPAWTDVIERLQAHGIRLEKLTEPVTAEFETYTLTEPKFAQNPFENHHPVRFKTTAGRERRTLPAGSIVVRLDQQPWKIAVHLLEPAAPDSCAAWGFFSSIFEQKEYGEMYALEKLAADMLSKDPALKKEFEDKLKSDEAFRSNPYARLDFFYRRSPYWDSHIGAYPVVRFDRGTTLKTVGLE